MQADNFFHRNANFVLAGSAKECKKESWNDIVKKFLFGSDQEEPTQGKTLAAVEAHNQEIVGSNPAGWCWAFPSFLHQWSVLNLVPQVGASLTPC